LRVSIRNVEGSVPGDTVLATTVFTSADVPFSQLVTFPQTVEIRTGVKYAIVVNLENPSPSASASWVIAGTDYAGGEACAQYSLDVPDPFWFCYSAEFQQPDFDNRFRTYVTPVPTSKDQCKSGGWRNYGVFKNQGDCVSYVATGGKNPPAGHH
jgi:hypothetical protein